MKFHHAQMLEIPVILPAGSRKFLRSRFASAIQIAVLSAVTALAISAARAQEKLQVVPMAAPEQKVLVPASLGIIVNLNEPESVSLGRRYAQLRGVPTENIIGLRLPKASYVAPHLMRRELDVLKSSGEFRQIAGFALAFSKPYRVGANQSITSVVALGVDNARFNGACNATRLNPDAGGPPGVALRAKPAMLLSVGDPALDASLLERGKAADGSEPSGTVHLIETLDAARSLPRETSMQSTKADLADSVAINLARLPEGLKNTGNIMGYQVGLALLPNLQTLSFLPGAYADHLTSYGGALNDGMGQTTITALIRAGATASYGTVREPCNTPAKFPDPRHLLGSYLSGDTILEAYWKSIGMPMEGLLMGEPLARPFGPFAATLRDGEINISANRHSRSHMLAYPQGANTLSVYDVRSGRPVYLAKLALPATLRAGDPIGAFPYDASKGEPILGVLVQ